MQYRPKLTNEGVLRYLREHDMLETAVYDNPGFPQALLGFSYDDHAVYSYEGMVRSLMENDGMTEEEAEDFLACNTLCTRAVEGLISPIVLMPDYDLVDYEGEQEDGNEGNDGSPESEDEHND